MVAARSARSPRLAPEKIAMGARPSLRLLILSAVMAVLAGVLYVAVLQRLGARAWSDWERNLRGHIVLLEQGIGTQLESVEPGELQVRTQWYGRVLGVRITRVAADGSVLADSEGNPQRMDNLATRAELVAALTEDFASCHRMSPTLGVDSLFVAHAVRHENRLVGWIRTSVRAEQVVAGLAAIQWSVIAMTAAAALAAFVLGGLWMQ